MALVRYMVSQCLGYLKGVKLHRVAQTKATMQRRKDRREMARRRRHH